MRFLFIIIMTTIVPGVLYELAAGQKDAATREALDKKIAARFAPIFHQGLGEEPRADYITNFDFDGDWRGDNNWSNLDNQSFPLKAYVYYSVVETDSHYFIHYAVFHPRDYKGGLEKSALLERVIEEGLRQIGSDPTGGLANDLALSHENDLEGALVVAEKKSSDPEKAVAIYVETMAHNQFFRYCAEKTRPGICEPILMEDQHPRIFIEPKGHGQMSFIDDRALLKNCVNGVETYKFTGQAQTPGLTKEKFTGYDLIPVRDTLWSRAADKENETYGAVYDYRERSVHEFRAGKSPVKVTMKKGPRGSAFRGRVGFKNKARPPWSWFDDSERRRPLGQWFFDPATVVADHFDLKGKLSTAYIYHPFFGIGMK